MENLMYNRIDLFGPTVGHRFITDTRFLFHTTILRMLFSLIYLFAHTFPVRSTDLWPGEMTSEWRAIQLTQLVESQRLDHFE